MVSEIWNCTQTKREQQKSGDEQQVHTVKSHAQ